MVEWQSVSEAAREFGITRVTIGRWIKSGNLKTRLAVIEAGPRKRMVRLVEVSTVRELVKTGVKRGRPTEAERQRRNRDVENPEFLRVAAMLMEFLALPEEAQGYVAEALGIEHVFQAAERFQKLADELFEKLAVEPPGKPSELKPKDWLQQAARVLKDRDALQRGLESKPAARKVKRGTRR